MQGKEYVKLAMRTNDGKLAEEHEQLAEWLEELKKLKAENAYLHCEMQAIGATMDMFETEIRNKAIDDFAKECEKRLTDMILQHQGQLDFASGLAVANRVLDDVSEKLKEGGTNGNSTTDS